MMRPAALAVCFAVTVAISASGGPQAPTPVFKSESHIVVLHVNVFDKDGAPVPRLSPDHFLVIDNGRAQELKFFSNEDVPVTVGLVIDNSSSMISRRPLVIAGGMAFADSSHPEDELFVVAFTEVPRLALPPQVPFTPSRPMLRATLGTLRPGGKTAFYDAIIAALDHLDRAGHQKRVLIVLSDGDDTASRATEKEMQARAKNSDAIIYTVGISEAASGGRGDWDVLKRLAKIGGGAAYFPRTEEDVVSSFQEIAAHVRQGYSIGYVPSDASEGARYREVNILVRAPGHRGLSARYRHGYSAPAAADPGTGN